MKVLALVLMAGGIAFAFSRRKHERSLRDSLAVAAAGLCTGAGFSLLMVVNEEGPMRIFLPYLSFPVFFVVVFHQFGREDKEGSV